MNSVEYLLKKFFLHTPDEKIKIKTLRRPDLKLTQVIKKNTPIYAFVHK